jgi:two-component system, NtrC family, response regulator AtoC
MSPPILIVDDEATFAKNVATFLTRHGYDVRRVETAEEGLVQLNAFRPAVVLQDFNLPGIDGLEMLAEIRRRDSRIKVILITGQGSEQVARDAMRAGAHGYLTKPLVLAKLKVVLEKTLGQERLEE